MLFMNTYEIEEALRRHVDHPVLGPATQQLAELEEWTNRNSDGWAYWPKPCRAAAALQTLIQQGDAAERGEVVAPVTPAAYKAALRPIKAFRTRQGADFALYEIEG